MVITYYGKASIRLAFGETIIAINPISRQTPSKSARFGADISLASLNESVFNGTGEMVAGGKETFVVTGPGEYELAGVFIRGFGSAGPKNKINTIYTIGLEGMKICHLGWLTTDPPPAVVEDISGADILFVPLGEEDTLSPSQAAKIASSLIPKLVVPVLYGGDEKAKALIDFLKDIGAEKITAVPKLSLKKKDLENEEAKAAVLKIS